MVSKFHRVCRPFWPRAATWHLEKFRVPKRKPQFPRARGTFGGELRPPQKFLTEIAPFLKTLCFGRPDPHGQEIAKYGFSRPVCPRAALGTWRNSGPKTENAISWIEADFWGGNPSAAKVSPENCATSLHFVFRPTGPPRSGNRKIRGFQALLA